jgi:hypothetical protein
MASIASFPPHLHFKGASAMYLPPLLNQTCALPPRGGERPALTPITLLKLATTVLSRSLAGLFELARGVHPRATVLTAQPDQRRAWSFSPNYAGYPDLTGSSSYRMPCPAR